MPVGACVTVQRAQPVSPKGEWWQAIGPTNQAGTVVGTEGPSGGLIMIVTSPFVAVGGGIPVAGDNDIPGGEGVGIVSSVGFSEAGAAELEGMIAGSGVAP